MEGVTRRTCITMGGVPMLAGLAAYGSRGLGQGESRPRFEREGSPRADFQRRHLPDVPLVTHDGERVRFYEDLVKDKKVVLTFVATRALAESAKVTRNLAAIQRFFGRRVGRDVFMYSIARSPERDTPARLRNWAVWSGAGPGWKFLTGDPADVETLRRGLGFASEDAAEDADPAHAVGLLRHGIEPEMRWAHCQSQGAPRVIAHSLLLDFGADPADRGVRTAWNLDGTIGAGTAPIWNCELLLADVA
jgi:protein SCO1/2